MLIDDIGTIANRAAAVVVSATMTAEMGTTPRTDARSPLAMSDDRPTVSSPDDDPYLHLEQIEARRSLEWVDAQNRRTLDVFGGSGLETESNALRQILDRPDRIPHVSRVAGHLRNFWRDETNPRGLLRRTTMASWLSSAPDWDVVLDLDALAREEREDWVFAGAQGLPQDERRSLLRLSRGGSDASVMREFDAVDGRFVDNGFQLPEAKGSAAWLDADTLLVASTVGGEDFVTGAGYARTVRRWRRGTPFEDAPIVFETAKEHMSVWAAPDRRHPEMPVYVVEQLGFFDTRTWLLRPNDEPVRFDVPADARLDIEADRMVVRPRTDAFVGGVDWRAGTLMIGSRDAFLAGEPHFETLFAPAERCAIEWFTFVDGAILVHVKDRLRSRYDRWRLEGGKWTNRPVPDLPDVGEVSVWPLDTHDLESDGTLLVSTSDPVTPPTLALLSPGETRATVVKRAPVDFDATGLVVTRHEAVADDGVRIPYVQIGPTTATGDAPVLMTGYGGFELSEEPYYDAVAGSLWLERGGTRVITHLRGGGEFGPAWHDAGRLANKRVSHDDFACIAQDLVTRGITVPTRIAAEGASNGGLLIANMLVRYPERFGALFCAIPLIDMRRYARLLAGASWISEYGDPAKPEDWAFIRTFSAYHLAESGRVYPPILIASSRSDDRVHPGHGRKMAAKLQAMGYDASYFEPATGGHGYGKDNEARARLAALGMRFLREKIGWP